jgi:hypothetical protein
MRFAPQTILPPAPGLWGSGFQPPLRGWVQGDLLVKVA